MTMHWRLYISMVMSSDLATETFIALNLSRTSLQMINVVVDN